MIWQIPVDSDLRPRSAAVHPLGLRIRIPQGVYTSLATIVCCHADVSETARFLVHNYRMNVCVCP